MNPADNPKEQRRMKGETDENTDMSENETEPETNPLRETEQSNGGRGKTDVSNLVVAMRNESTYYVGNLEEGTAYLVNMCNPEHEDEMTCTCPDYPYRVAPDEDRACKHILAVIAKTPADMQIGNVAYERLKGEYRMLSEKIDSVTQDLTNASVNATTSQPSQSASVPASDAAGDGQQMQSATAEEAAEKLQSAYNDAVNGMNVEAYNGRVWVNKSPDAPDFTFDAFLSGPSLMQYDPDGDSPGQYFKNYIEPSDVDAYISEVLE